MEMDLRLYSILKPYDDWHNISHRGRQLAW